MEEYRKEDAGVGQETGNQFGVALSRAFRKNLAVRIQVVDRTQAKYTHHHHQ